jgi:hypothetical protein
MVYVSKQDLINYLNENFETEMNIGTIYYFDISFKQSQKGFSEVINHKDSSSFMSKVVWIIDQVQNKLGKGTLFSFSGANDKKVRVNKNKEFSTKRIMLYHRLLKKFVKPENIVKINNNQLMFLNENKNQLRELNIPSNVSQSTIKNLKLKFHNSKYDPFEYDVESYIEKVMNELDIEDKHLLNNYVIFNSPLDFKRLAIFYLIDTTGIEDKIFEVNFSRYTLNDSDLTDWIRKSKNNKEINDFFNQYRTKYK